LAVFGLFFILFFVRFYRQIQKLAGEMNEKRNEKQMKNGYCEADPPSQREKQAKNDEKQDLKNGRQVGCLYTPLELTI
jgi:hypothetical protein